MDPKRILIVDDEEDICDMVHIVLTKEGYSVSTAKDGLHAIKKISEKPYDLILLDIMMPVVDGWEFIDQATEKNLLQNTKILVYSVGSDPDKMLKKYGCRIDGILHKASHINKIKQKIKDTLEN